MTSTSIQWIAASNLLAGTAPLAFPQQVHVIAALPWLDRGRAQQAAELMVSRAGVPLTVLAVQDDMGMGPVPLWNAALRRTQSAFFIYTAEDAFAGRYWLRFALQAMQAPTAGLCAFNDGKWFGQLAAFGLVRRSWLEPIYRGLLFHPDYRQHYGDTELTLIARQQGALVYHPNALLVEVDHLKDQREVFAPDHDLFRMRAAGKFDGLVPDSALVDLFR